MGYYLSSRLTATLNLCLIYFKTTWALAILLQHMHKKFEINRTNIKGSCQSGWKVVTHDSKSDLPLIKAKGLDSFAFSSPNPGSNWPSHCAILMKLGMWYWVDHRLMHMLWICSYLASKINSQKSSSHWIWAKSEQSWQFGPWSKFLDIVKNALSLFKLGVIIFFVSWFHTPNRSKSRAFLTTPKILDIKYEILDIWSKVLWCFSYLLCEINSPNEFITLNLSKFGAFLTIWSWIQIFEQCQKCSNCAHIWCDEFFWWVDFINKIWAQSEHFWQLPNFG